MGYLDDQPPDLPTITPERLCDSFVGRTVVWAGMGPTTIGLRFDDGRTIEISMDSSIGLPTGRWRPDEG